MLYIITYIHCTYIYAFVAYIQLCMHSHTCTHTHTHTHTHINTHTHIHNINMHIINLYTYKWKTNLIISFSKGLPSFMNISMKQMLIGLLAIILLCLFVVGTAILTTALDKTGGVFIMIISCTCLC